VSDIDTMIDRLSDRQRREFALWCAERVRHLMTDPRSTNALDVAARHLRGEATDAELTAARAAARDAATGLSVIGLAEVAAFAAPWDAAWAASASAAARVAADAARNAARDTERAAQRAELKRMLGEVTS
jgi:hypothetical protein